jgi:hypothetical protein
MVTREFTAFRRERISANDVFTDVASCLEEVIYLHIVASQPKAGKI